MAMDLPAADHESDARGRRADVESRSLPEVAHVEVCPDVEEQQPAAGIEAAAAWATNNFREALDRLGRA